MALSRRAGRSRFTLAILVLTSITVLTLDFRGGMGGLRDVAATVFSPVRSAADAVFDPVGNAWDGVFGYGELEEENEALQARIDELEGDELREENYEERIEEITELLAAADLDFVGDIPTVTARVVGSSPSNFDDTVQLDKGSADGIGLDMPVVTGAGLVGRVVQVSGGSSVVRLVTDPSSQIGVELVGVNDTAVARGTGDGEPLVVDGGIEAETDVSEGVGVVTSSLSSVFPPDLNVGRVTGVDDTDTGDGQAIQIAPLAELDALSYVNVLDWEPTSQ